jgi:hypothetical protein
MVEGLQNFELFPNSVNDVVGVLKLGTYINLVQDFAGVNFLLILILVGLIGVGE